MPLVQPQNVAIYSPIRRLGKSQDTRDLRHRLHAVLGVEPSHKHLILLDRRACPPDPPEMDVPRTDRAGRVGRGGRRSLPIVDFRMFLLQDIREGQFEDGVVHLLDQLSLSLGEWTLPAPLPPANPDLVVAVPQAKRRVVANPLHVISHFPGNVLQDFLAAWVKCAGEHEVVPNQNASFVHALIELVFLKLPSSPQPNHVIPCEKSVLSDLLIGLLAGPRQRHLRRDVVASSHVYVIAVEVKSEGGPAEAFALLDY